MTHRIAILADIHANVWALDAVLEDVRNQGVDALLNLGDILYGPLKPLDTYNRLRNQKVLLTIRGNQDRQIYDATPEERRSNPTLNYVIEDLGADAIRWLESLPPTAVFDDEIFLCHGTPESDETYLLEDVMSGQPLVRSDAEIVQLLGDVRHLVVVCGHTHIPRLVRLSSGQTIVNPGSVGLPAFGDNQPVPHAMQTYSPHASYAILTKSAAGWDVAFQKVAYQNDDAARVAASLGREDWAQGIATGRV